MNGFLSPKGIMHECDYEKHWELARKLKEKYFDEDWCDYDLWVVNNNGRTLKNWGFLYFGATGDLGTNTDSYIFLDYSNMRITEEQEKWVEENKNKITNKQYETFKELLEERIPKQEKRRIKNENK